MTGPCSDRFSARRIPPAAIPLTAVVLLNCADTFSTPFPMETIKPMLTPLPGKTGYPQACSRQVY